MLLDAHPKAVFKKNWNYGETPLYYAITYGNLNIIQMNMTIWMILKILFLFLLFALIKAIVPRYRYDQLMRLGWKIFLPLSLAYVILTASYLFYFNLLPTT